MKKKDKKQVGKGNKAQKKEKKQKDPKEYIPQNLLPNLRTTKLIASIENSARGIEEDEASQNYSPDYKPEFIPCKIAEEWKPTTEEEINNEFLQYEKENAELHSENNDMKKNVNQNQNKKESKNEDKKKEKEKEKNKNSKSKEKDNKGKKVEENKNENNNEQNSEEEEQNEVDPEILKKLKIVKKKSKMK